MMNDILNRISLIDLRCTVGLGFKNTQRAFVRGTHEIRIRIDVPQIPQQWHFRGPKLRIQGTAQNDLTALLTFSNPYTFVTSFIWILYSASTVIAGYMSMKRSHMMQKLHNCCQAKLVEHQPLRMIVFQFRYFPISTNTFLTHTQTKTTG